MLCKKAKFNVGDCVRHLQHGYIAVIIDADPLFQSRGRNPQAHKREFACRSPWYRLLVDDSSQITYVEETQLAAELDHAWIDNPHFSDYLGKKQKRFYRREVTH